MIYLKIQLNLKKMQQFIKTGNSFIYDTTGAGKEYTDTGFEHLKSIFDLAKVADHFKEDADKIKWENAFHFFQRALPD